MTLAIYGDTNTIAEMLESDTPSGFSAALTARIDDMREVVSRMIDEKTGRTFGVVGTSETRVIRGSSASSVLVLPAPARSISAVTIDVTDEAGVVSGGTALSPSQWTIALSDDEGNITAITAGWGVWWGTVSVTGIWADTDTDTVVPAEITWLCNYVSAKTIAEENASPAGFVGPDGTMTFPRNPWSHPQVRDILRTYRIPQRAVVL